MLLLVQTAVTAVVCCCFFVLFVGVSLFFCWFCCLLLALVVFLQGMGFSPSPLSSLVLYLYSLIVKLQIRIHFRYDLHFFYLFSTFLNLCLLFVCLLFGFYLFSLLGWILHFHNFHSFLSMYLRLGFLQFRFLGIQTLFGMDCKFSYISPFLPYNSRIHGYCKERRMKELRLLVHQIIANNIVKWDLVWFI